MYGYKVKRVKVGRKRNKDVNKDAEKNQANDGDTGGSVKLKVRIEPVLLGLKTKSTYYAR